MNIQYNCFPNGNKIALTLSFDDGRIHDRRLISILNQYGLKGTFHLNSGFFGLDSYINKSEIKELYQGHEVSAHSLTHPHLTQIPNNEIIHQLLEDKRNLEILVGYPIRGMSYPFGDYNSNVIEHAKMVGLEYSRTVKSTMNFKLPDDFMEWHPTVHIKSELSELWNQCLDNRFNEMRCFYVWSHSYEFEDNQTWDMMEDFCRMVSVNKDVWFATNSEIKSYMDALKRLVVSVNSDRIMNPSSMDVWVSINDQSVCIKSGETYHVRGK